MNIYLKTLITILAMGIPLANLAMELPLNNQLADQKADVTILADLIQSPILSHETLDDLPPLTIDQELNTLLEPEIKQITSTQINDFPNNLPDPESLDFTACIEEEANKLAQESSVSKNKPLKMHKGFILKHINLKDGTKNYICPYQNCNTAITHNNLTNHMLTHTDQKDYKCIYCYCYPSFNKKDHLINHMQTHTREKNYECRFCDKTFGYSQNLIAHERSHTGEKRYTCTHQGCDQAFISLYKLKKHKRTHE
jgi:uncharacterized Zn-finger protein